MLGVGCHNYKEIEKDMIRAGSSLVIADFLSDKVNSLYVWVSLGLQKNGSISEQPEVSSKQDMK